MVDAQCNNCDQVYKYDVKVGQACPRCGRSERTVPYSPEGRASHLQEKEATYRDIERRRGKRRGR